MSEYEKNRTIVFAIYGIDPKDKEYNCHHIVTRKDYKEGLVSPDFDIDGKSNLFPIKINLHKILNEIIEAVDNGDNFKPLLVKCRKSEIDSQKKNRNYQIIKQIKFQIKRNDIC